MADTRPLADALSKASITQYGVTKFAEDGEATVGEAVQSNDARLSNGRPPTGTAGGVLSGSYPNPGFAEDMATQIELAAVQTDATDALTAAAAAETSAASALTAATDATTAADAATDAAATAIGELALHLDDTSNPHAVTAAQVGAATPADIATHASIAPGASTRGHPTVDEIDARVTAGIAGSGSLTNPMTTAGDLIVGGASGTPARLAKGSDNQILVVDPTTHLLAWANKSVSTGVAGRVGWYSAAELISAYSNTIFRDSSTGYIGIGTEVPALPVTIDLTNRLSGNTSGSTFSLSTTKDDAAVDGTCNVHSVAASYTPPTQPTGTRIWTALRASATISSAFSFAMNHRAMNALALYAGTGALSGVSTGQYAQVQNSSTGSIAAGYAVSGIIQNTGAGTISHGCALRALRPIGAAGAVLTRSTGLFVEQQSAASGTTTTAEGIYQEGAADQNTFKGPTQFDGKITVAGGTAGIPRVLGGWVAETAPAIADHYGSITAIVDVDSTFVDVVGYAVTAPSASACTFDIEYKRGAGAWTTLFSALPSFAAGANTISTGTKSVTSLNAGDLIRLNFDAVNGAAGITIAMKMQTR